MPNTTLELDHVALPMIDPFATRAFYRDVLGLALVSALEGPDWDGRRWLMMIFSDRAGHELALCGFGGPQHALDGAWPTDARHYAFAVADRGALDTWKAKLDTAKVAWREEDHGNQRSLYFADPNGTTLEITVHLGGYGPEASAAADAVIDAWIAAKV